MTLSHSHRTCAAARFCIDRTALLAAGCCLAFLLAGCALSRQTAPLSITSSTPTAEIIAAVNGQRAGVITMHAKGSIAVESPSFSNSASFDLALRRPDSVKLQITGPFGIRVASILFTGDHYLFYNSLRNQVMEGSVSPEHLPVMMKFSISPDDILDTFCGTRTFEDDESIPDSCVVGDIAVTLVFHRRSAWTRYIVDRSTARILQITKSDSAGSVVSEEFYEYDVRDDGTVVPQSIRITREALSFAVSLFYDSVELNEPIERLMLNIPPDAVRVSPDQPDSDK